MCSGFIPEIRSQGLCPETSKKSLGNRCAGMACGLFQSIKNESGPHFATTLAGLFLVHTIKNALSFVVCCVWCRSHRDRPSLSFLLLLVGATLKMGVTPFVSFVSYFLFPLNAKKEVVRRYNSDGVLATCHNIIITM
jgi:hypothetical protein